MRLEDRGGTSSGQLKRTIHIVHQTLIRRGSSSDLRYMAYLCIGTHLSAHEDNETRWVGTHFRVHSRAVASYRCRSVLYKCAISGTSGSSGFGSVNIEQIERRTVNSNTMSQSTFKGPNRKTRCSGAPHSDHNRFRHRRSALQM